MSTWTRCESDPGSSMHAMHALRSVSNLQPECRVSGRSARDTPAPLRNIGDGPQIKPQPWHFEQRGRRQKRMRRSRRESSASDHTFKSTSPSCQSSSYRAANSHDNDNLVQCTVTIPWGGQTLALFVTHRGCSSIWITFSIIDAQYTPRDPTFKLSKWCMVGYTSNLILTLLKRGGRRGPARVTVKAEGEQGGQGAEQGGDGASRGGWRLISWRLVRAVAGAAVAGAAVAGAVAGAAVAGAAVAGAAVAGAGLEGQGSQGQGLRGSVFRGMRCRGRMGRGLHGHDGQGQGCHMQGRLDGSLNITVANGQAHGCRCWWLQAVAPGSGSRQWPRAAEPRACTGIPQQAAGQGAWAGWTAAKVFVVVNLSLAASRFSTFRRGHGNRSLSMGQGSRNSQGVCTGELLYCQTLPQEEVQYAGLRAQDTG
ncbi:predicted protein [Haematococcus lacustris]|uniref:Uncharacterized protein n=1 Tax=Haematococcus lacustris TaxID=44745 RepID=A0A699YPR3_HAELA|nr:predicted protein [Haematococcus lacustris]